MNLLRIFRLVLLLLAGIWHSSLPAQANRPLLIEGKTSIYQRILSLPGGQLFPDGIESGDSVELPAFSVYYVYDREKSADGAEWLRIGLDRFGNRDGWIRSKRTLAWNQGLTLTFRNPTVDSRVLLFSDRSAIREIADNYDVPLYKRLYKQASQGKIEKDSPVVAIQPAEQIDIRKNFYLLPIHDFEDLYVDGKTAKLLEVSSISVRDQNADNGPRKMAPETTGNREYTAGIEFVIDATRSMQPYINRTRQATRKIYQALEKEGLLGNMRFGLVAFRDNVNAAHGVGFLTRRMVSLEQGTDSRRFLAGTRKLRAGLFPTRDFVEDSYAGIHQVLEETDWAADTARYIVVITDAGPRDAGDPLSSTGLNATQLNRMALDKGIAVFVLHLLSPDPTADNDTAATHYKTLSNYPGIGSLYYPVTAANVTEFGDVIDTLAGQISAQIKAVQQKTEFSPEPAPENSKLAALREKTARLGHALRLKYLRSSSSQAAPDVFNAWLLDKNFLDPNQSAVDVCALLTRDQLSDLHDILTRILETAEQGLISPQNFLSDLKSIAATISRDPEQLGSTTASTATRGQSLAELGFLREYIEDLPYTGQVMNLALDDWQSWNTARQVGFLNQLEEKVAYYRALHDQPDIWISLDGSPIDGNSVFPVPLDMLP